VGQRCSSYIVDCAYEFSYGTTSDWDVGSVAPGSGDASLCAIGEEGKANRRLVNPNGAVHTVLRSISEAKQLFIYSPTLAIPEVPHPADGLYRLEVNEKGKVAAVTILRGVSPNADTFAMKQFAAWYAKPGPLRIVDVPVVYATTPKLLNPFTSRRTGLPP